nr:hypothetical protein [Tanacetum cinerariifolium]
MFLMTLPQDRTYGKVACITHKFKWQVKFRAIKVGASVSFSLMSGKLRCNLQRKRMVYPSQEGESSAGNFRKILNESSVKTDVTEKTPNTFNSGGMRSMGIWKYLEKPSRKQ